MDESDDENAVGLIALLILGVVMFIAVIAINIYQCKTARKVLETAPRGEHPKILVNQSSFRSEHEGSAVAPAPGGELENI